MTAWRLPLAGLLLGLLGAGLALEVGQRVATDNSVFWHATQDLVAGRNPYAVQYTDWPLFYPLPALLILAPLAWLPAWGFHLATAGLSGLALGAAASRRPALGPALLSAGFFASVAAGQWAPVLTAAAVLPWLAPIWIAKPSLGLALFAGYPHRAAVVGGVALLGISLALFPSWPLDWLHNLRQTNHVPPILRPGGFLLLLALLKWREPEARMLAALAVVPHTVSIGDGLLLALCARTKWEGYALAGLSYVAAVVYGSRISVDMTLVESVARGWPAVLLLCHLPALYLVLRAPPR